MTLSSLSARDSFHFIMVLFTGCSEDVRRPLLKGSYRVWSPGDGISNHAGWDLAFSKGISLRPWWHIFILWLDKWAKRNHQRHHCPKQAKILSTNPFSRKFLFKTIDRTLLPIKKVHPHWRYPKLFQAIIIQNKMNNIFSELSLYKLQFKSLLIWWNRHRSNM